MGANYQRLVAYGVSMSVLKYIKSRDWRPLTTLMSQIWLNVGDNLEC
jgi:hypothetical protein